MVTEWHFTQNGQPAGTPVSAAQLKQMAQAGQLLPTDMVWQEGMTTWAPAGSIKGLFGPGKAAETPSGFEKVSGAPRNRKGDGAAAEALRVAAEALRDPTPARDLMDLHPVLVLLLTVCTFGLFGLWYSYQVCSAYSALAARRKTDAAGRRLGRARHPVWVLMMTYLTAGYYFYWWIYRVMQECSAYTGREDVKPRIELCLMLIFPLYALYVAVFRLPEMIKRAQGLAGIPESTAVGHSYVFLNPCMFCALPFLGMLYQDALNQVWFTAP
jgi:hypothetical protein